MRLDHRKTKAELIAELNALRQRLAQMAGAEAALRESEVRFRLAFSTSPDAVNFNRLEDGLYVDINEGFTRLTGFTRADVIGKTSLEINIWHDPADRKKLVQGLLTQGYYEGLEAQFRRKDGSLTTALMSARVVALAGVPHILSITHDITERKQAEVALRASEAQFRAFMDNLPALVIIKDHALRPIYFNDQYNHFFPGQAWLGKTPRETFPPAIAEAMEAADYKAFSEGHVLYEETWLDQAGAARFYETRKFVIDRAGLEPLLGVIITDITERKQAEAALRASEQQLRLITDNLPASVSYVDAHDLRYRFVNRAFAAVFGMAPEQMQGKQVREILGEVAYARALPYIDQARAGKRIDYENLIPARGEPRWFSLTYIPEFDPHGAVQNLVVLAVDITARKQAEAALRESSERLIHVLANSPTAIYVLKVEGDQAVPVWISGNVAIILGFSVEEALQPTWWPAHLHPDDRPRVLAALAHLFADHYQHEYRFVRNDGRVVWLHDEHRLLRDADGAPREIIGAWTNITERKQAEEALRQLNAELEQRVDARTAELSARTAELSATNAQLVRAMRAKDDFLSAMSHELRTPLTAVLGLSEILQLNVHDPLNEQQLHYVQLIHQSGEHLLALINDVLDLAKVSAGRLELQISPVGVISLCQAACHLVAPQADKKHITVSLALDPAVTEIQADARRLKQILINLLGNAVKFTPAGGQVALAVHGDAEQQRVDFTVRDTGVGIAPEDLPRLFQDFVQLDARLAREYEGTGLGLAMVRRLVELHGGQVRAESEGLGKGSRFTVSLPWVAFLERAAPAEEAPPRPAVARAAGPAATGRAPLILVVDDQPIVLLAVQRIVQANGYRVETIQDSRTAWALARALQPALMLIDVQMPYLDGLELIRQIRADPDLASLPLIALTALAMPGDRERCLQAGANDYLSKPVPMTDLLRAIRRLLSPTEPQVAD